MICSTTRARQLPVEISRVSCTASSHIWREEKYQIRSERREKRFTHHIGCYHNGEVAGGHLVLLLQLADLVEQPEEVLDVPVVLPGQGLVLQEVPHQVEHLRGVLQPPRLQPVGVELRPEERLRELSEVGLDGGGEEVVVSRL